MCTKHRIYVLYKANRKAMGRTFVSLTANCLCDIFFGGYSEPAEMANRPSERADHATRASELADATAHPYGNIDSERSECVKTTKRPRP